MCACTRRCCWSASDLMNLWRCLIGLSTTTAVLHGRADDNSNNSATQSGIVYRIIQNKLCLQYGLSDSGSTVIKSHWQPKLHPRAPKLYIPTKTHTLMVHLWDVNYPPNNSHRPKLCHLSIAWPQKLLILADFGGPGNPRRENFHWCMHAHTFISKWSKSVQDKWLKSALVSW